MSAPIEFEDIRPGDTVRRILTEDVKVDRVDGRWLETDHGPRSSGSADLSLTWEFVDRPVKPLKPGTVVRNGSGTEWVVLEDGAAVRRAPSDGSWCDAAMTAEDLATAISSGRGYHAGPYTIVWEPGE